MDDMYEVPSTPRSRYLVTSLPSSPCRPSSCLPHVTFQPACTAWHTWSSEQAPQDSPRGTLSSLKRPLALAGAFWEASGRGHLSGQRRFVCLQDMRWPVQDRPSGPRHPQAADSG